MPKEIKPPKADVLEFKGRDYTPYPDCDIEAVRQKLLELANDIDKISDKTRWPRWSQDQARAMRDFCADLGDMDK